MNQHQKAEAPWKSSALKAQEKKKKIVDRRRKEKKEYMFPCIDFPIGVHLLSYTIISLVAELDWVSGTTSLTELYTSRRNTERFFVKLYRTKKKPPSQVKWTEGNQKQVYTRCLNRPIIYLDLLPKKNGIWNHLEKLSLPKGVQTNKIHYLKYQGLLMHTSSDWWQVHNHKDSLVLVFWLQISLHWFHEVIETCNHHTLPLHTLHRDHSLTPCLEVLQVRGVKQDY